LKVPVGAIINRPAVQSLNSLQFSANTKHFTARAVNNRPYIPVPAFLDSFAFFKEGYPTGTCEDAA